MYFKFIFLCGVLIFSSFMIDYPCRVNSTLGQPLWAVGHLYFLIFQTIGGGGMDFEYIISFMLILLLLVISIKK